MTLYLSAIAILSALLTACNMFFAAPVFGFGFLYALGMVFLAVVAEIAVDGLFAFLIRRLPAAWFSHDKKIFSVSRGEKRFYEKLGIRRWKDKIPELGQFTSFRKNKIADPKNNEYLTRYLLEAAYGEVIHFALLFLGFLVVLFFPLEMWMCFGFPVAVCNIFLNLPSLFILRYNFYKLKILFGINERRARREALAESERMGQVWDEVAFTRTEGENETSGKFF